MKNFLARQSSAITLSLLVLAFGGSITLWVWQEASLHAADQLRYRLERNAGLLANRIQRDLTTYEQALRGTRGLFSASQDVTRDEFRLYAADLLIEDRYKGLQGLGYAKAVPKNARDEHIAFIRAQGFPEYTISPLGDRDFYTSIIYLEPFKNENLRAFGYDMYSERTRRTAMEAAASSGETRISGKVSLVQYSGDADSTGFLIYLPVYKNGAETLPERDKLKAVNGWVYMPVRMLSFMEGFEKDHKGDFNFEIYDSSDTERNLLYKLSHGTQAAEKITTETEIRLPGRTWALQLSPTARFIQENSSLKPIFILIAGALSSLILAWIIFLIAKDRAHAQQLANKLSNNLNQSESRWRYALKEAGDGMWEWNHVTGEVYYSKRWKEMLGYTDAEFENNFAMLERLLHPEDKARVLKAAMEHHDGKAPLYEQEYRMLHKNGSIIWVLARGTVVDEDENGAPLRSMGTHTDITQLKNTQLALMESEGRFHNSFVTAVIGMALVDLEGRFLKVNQSFCEMLGMSEDELLTKTFKEITHPDDLEKDLQNVNRLLEGEDNHYQMKKRYFHKNGNVLWVNLSVSIVRDANNAPLYFVSQIKND